MDLDAFIEDFGTDITLKVFVFTVIIEATLPQLLQDMYLLLPCLLVPTRILALRCLPQEEQLEELLSQTKEMVDIVDVLEQARTAKVFIGIGM